MASKGWLNLESAGNLVPDTHFFEGESAFNFLGLTRAQRLYGFVGWSVLSAACLASPPTDPPPVSSSALSSVCWAASFCF